ncbi:MAG: DUF72 domain-containing protein [Chloroflexia bacterium]
MIWIGTSGWVYKHWIGCFYPHDLKQKHWLSHYALHFPTVEINRSFYSLPTQDNFRSWANQAGFHHGFQFATKASRYPPHLKRLKEPEEPLALTLYAAEELWPHI